MKFIPLILLVSLTYIQSTQAMQASTLKYYATNTWNAAIRAMRWLTYVDDDYIKSNILILACLSNRANLEYGEFRYYFEENKEKYMRLPYYKTQQLLSAIMENQSTKIPDKIKQAVLEAKKDNRPLLSFSDLHFGINDISPTELYTITCGFLKKQLEQKKMYPNKDIFNNKEHTVDFLKQFEEKASCSIDKKEIENLFIKYVLEEALKMRKS